MVKVKEWVWLKERVGVEHHNELVFFFFSFLPVERQGRDKAIYAHRIDDSSQEQVVCYGVWT